MPPTIFRDVFTSLIFFASGRRGFTGPGSIELEGDSDVFDVMVNGEDAEGTLELSGKFERNDEEALPSPTALYIYLDGEDAPSDFIRGFGEIYVATSEFTANRYGYPRRVH